MNLQDILTPREASKLFGINYSTIITWINRSEKGTMKHDPLPLDCFRRTEDGTILITYEAIASKSGFNPRGNDMPEGAKYPASVVCPSCNGDGYQLEFSPNTRYEKSRRGWECALCHAKGEIDTVTLAEWVNS